jgi:hypothetical protein
MANIFPEPGDIGFVKGARGVFEAIFLNEDKDGNYLVFPVDSKNKQIYTVKPENFMSEKMVENRARLMADEQHPVPKGFFKMFGEFDNKWAGCVSDYSCTGEGYEEDPGDCY